MFSEVGSSKDNKAMESVYQGQLSRIMEACGAQRAVDLANFLGISAQGVTESKRNRKIPLPWFFTAAEKTNVYLDWLVFGRGPKFCGDYEIPQPSLRRVSEAAQLDFGIILIKKVGARLSAGTGSFIADDHITGLYGFREDWIKAKGRPESLVLMDVWGDSMSPKIEDKDTVLINTAKKEIMTGRIYAFGLDDEILIKEADRKPGGVEFKSINPRFNSITIDFKDENPGFVLIGTVVWWCREAR